MAVGHVPRNRRFHLSTHHDNGLLHRKHGPAGAGLAPFYGFTGINEAGISASETAVTTLDEKELRPAHTTVNFALNIDVPMLGLPFYWRNNTFSPNSTGYTSTSAVSISGFRSRARPTSASGPGTASWWTTGTGG